MAPCKLHLVFLALLFFSGGALAAAGTTANGTATAAATPATASRVRSLASSASQGVVFSLDRYGARGDGRHDDTPALSRAWKAACASPRPAVVLVPGGKRYLLKLVKLSGPCKSSVTVTVKGTLVASPNTADWSDRDRRHWIVFRAVDKLTVNGGGAVDGNGETWWKRSCKINKAMPCKEAPTALSFHYCTSLRVQDLKIVNSQQIHMSVEDCASVQLTGLSITASGTSPNTDGIHITRSKDVQVTNCKIKTGDDCMSIENGTHNLHVSQVVCGPGHGISIGSLGDDNSRAEVSGITIDSVQLYGTTNGARIKTYQGGSGYAKDITFQNMIMDNVKNPIIIDQDYCDKAKPCKAQGSAVEVSNVVFKNIRGTTVTKDAIKLNYGRHTQGRVPSMRPACRRMMPPVDAAVPSLISKFDGARLHDCCPWPQLDEASTSLFRPGTSTSHPIALVAGVVLEAGQRHHGDRLNPGLHCPWRSASCYDGCGEH